MARSQATAVEGACDLGGRRLGVSGGRVLVAAIVRHRGGLRRLLLADNALCDVGTEALAAVLPLCKRLDTLDLSWNGIGRRGAAAVAGAMVPSSVMVPAGGAIISTGEGELPSSLRTLQLLGSRIGDAGVALLATALGSGNSPLSRLDLWDSTVGDVGIGSLGRALADSQLRILGLWGTPFGDGMEEGEEEGEGEREGGDVATGLAAICQALSRRAPLAELNLWGNSTLTPSGLARLCVAARTGHCQLRSVTLSCDVPPRVAAQLRDALDDNATRAADELEAEWVPPAHGEWAVAGDDPGGASSAGEQDPWAHAPAPIPGGRSQRRRSGLIGGRTGPTRKKRHRPVPHAFAQAHLLPQGGDARSAVRRPGGAMSRRTHPTLERRSVTRPRSLYPVQ